MKINKKRWMQIHTYLSLFFLPAALIYALTGVLYIFEIRQDSGAKILEFELESMPKNGEEQAFILHILQENNLKIPSDIAITGKIIESNICELNQPYSFLSANVGGKTPPFA